MTATKTVTKKSRVLNALVKGKSLTAEQMRARFDVGTPSAVVSTLRNEGFNIILYTKVSKKGVKTTSYRLNSAAAGL